MAEENNIPWYHNKDDYYNRENLENEESREKVAQMRGAETYGAYTVPEEFFSLPEMGDFYLGAIDDDYLRLIDRIIEGIPAEKYNEGSGKKAAFYTETPKLAEGEIRDGAAFSEVNDVIFDDELGWQNPSSIRIPLSSIKDENVRAQIKAQFGNSLGDNASFIFTQYGISCPTQAKTAKEFNVSKNLLEVKYYNSSAEWTGQPNHVYTKDHEGGCNFVRIGDTWHQTLNWAENDNNTANFTWVVSQESGPKDSRLNALKRLDDIEKNSDGKYYICFDLDAGTTKTDSNFGDIASSLDAQELLKKWNDGNKDSGYNLLQEDQNARLTGTLYTKVDGKWVNVTKALIFTNDKNVRANNSFVGDNNEVFSQNYSSEHEVYADAYFKVIDALDDRKKIQFELFGLSWEDLHKWTVTIGDVTFYCPPVNINIATQTEEERVALLRASSSMPKSGFRSFRTIQLTVYFYDDRGINGYKYKVKTPSGKTFVYSFNGLRALISHFKFAPFAPIENDYINNTIGIDAVTLDSLSVNSVLGHPHLLMANVTLTEFDWSVYMTNQAAIAADFEEKRNWFSAAYNWPVFRYYYQKALLAGDDLASKGYDSNSKEYLKAILENRTALEPMQFKDFSIKFFIADMNYLNRLLEDKLKSYEQRQQGLNLSPTTTKFLKELTEEAKNRLDTYFGDKENPIKTLVAEINAKPYTICYNGNQDGTVIIESKDGVLKNLPGFSKEQSENDEFLRKVNPLALYSSSTGFYKATPEGDNMRLQFGFSWNVLENANDSDRKVIKEEVSQQLSFIAGGDANTFFQDGKIRLSYSVLLKRQDDGTFVGKSILRPDTGSFGENFLKYLSSDPLRLKNTPDSGNGVTEFKRAGNIVSLETLKYVPFTTGSFEVVNFNVLMANRFSRINIQDVNGASPQFLGGGDITFNVTLQTKDKKAAEAFSKVPQIISHLMRKYRRVIPCCPFKMDSEFSRLFGVHEVSINNVQVNTVPNHPGVYSIDFVAISTDRTMRTREALQVLEANNSGDRFSNKTAQKKINSYFEVNKMIEKAELYPDLELPTLQEMGDIGYSFVRYKFQDDRVYVDPDFYYVYTAVLSSKLLRELILRGVDKGLDGSTDLRDQTGAIVRLTPNAFTGYNIIGQNEVASKQFDAILNMNSLKSTLNSKSTPENLEEKDKDQEIQDFEGWDICNDIKAIFLEKRYLKEYNSYVGRVNSATLKNIDLTKDEKTQQEQRKEQEKQTKPSQELVAEGAWVYKRLENAREASNAINEYLQKKIDVETQSPQPDTIDKLVSFMSENGIDVTDIKDAVIHAVGAKAGGKALAAIGAKMAARFIPGIGEIILAADIVSVIYDIVRGLIDDDKRKERLEKIMHGETTKALEEGLSDENRKDINVNQRVELLIKNTVHDFFVQPEVTKILELLNFDNSKEFEAALKDIVYAAACAGTGEKEFSNKTKATNWRPDPNFRKVNWTPAVQDSTSRAVDNSSNYDEAMMFGIFGIRAYTKPEIEKITKDAVVSRTKDMYGNPTVNYAYVLDPYYREAPQFDVTEYKSSCALSIRYSTFAFCRLILYWLKRLIDIQAFPSINGDILRQTTHTELQIQEIEKEHGVSNQEKDSAMRRHIKFFSRATHALDAGKIWTAAVLSASEGSALIFDKINQRDYRALNEYVNCCSNPKTTISSTQKTDMAIRKMYMALIGMSRITDKSAAGVEQNNPAMDFARSITEMKYISAAEDPKQFMMHACHDMIVHDARGRMLRAFPTYYIMFIDEGRDIGLWHLHDNFYNSMSIMEFSVVKDRKNPADTLILKMSNLYQSFSTEGEDRLQYPEETWGQAIDSIFSPTEYGMKQEAKRQGSDIQDRIRIRPGARLHLRAGYGSSAAMLPILFNGTVAEVNAQDTIDLTAQGDGIELVNPIIEELEASEMTDNSFLDYIAPRNNMTPLNIMNRLLTTDGGLIRSYLKDFGKGHLIEDNPYGIFHFGDKNFKSVIKAGEPTQNIYEAISTPIWGNEEQNNKGKLWGTDDAPVINIDMFNKSVWDIANICKSVVPDFICAVAPFNYRSTLFIGMPRYYYAYDYLNMNGAIQEKRKPYQQYHLYTSTTDIISNGIVASSQTMKTSATGLYQDSAMFNSKEQKKVGPLFVDIDIYPENQKSMIVDTQLWGKNSALSFNPIASIETIDDLFDDKGEHVSWKKIAWRMTASALKDSVKEMYAGDIVLLGDPSIKPHDRVYMVDTYQGLSGQCTAKEVVHSMSVDNGFITTVSPDAINVVDDKFEIPVQQWVDTSFRLGASHMIAAGSVAKFALGTKAILASAASSNVLKTLEAAKNSEAGKKLISETKNIRELGLVDKAGNLIKDGVGHLKESKYFGGIGKYAEGAIDAASSIFKTGANPVAKATFGRITARLLPLFTGADIACSFVGQAVNNYMKNLQVVTVFPLKRYGLPWVAGLAGSKGLVYGSHTFNQQGAVTSILSEVFKKRDGIMGAVQDFFSSGELEELAEKYRRDNKLTSKIDDPTLGIESFSNSLRIAQSTPSGELDKLKQDYRRLQVRPRANYDSKDEIMASYEKFAMTNIRGFQNDPKLKNNLFISEDRRLLPYIEEGFFKIVHEIPGLNTGKFVDSKIINVNGQKKYVKTIEDTDGENVVYDVPLLNRDALDILYELIRRAKMNMPAVNSSDPKETYEQTKTSFIALESALRIGETSTYAAAGFTFVLQATEYAVPALAQAVKSLHDEVEKEQGVNSEVSIFDSSDIGDNKLAIVVRMPKVTNAPSQDQTQKKDEDSKKANNTQTSNLLMDDPDAESLNRNIKRSMIGGET